MNILLITPAAKGSQSGNRVTAVRWGSLLRRLGHRVRISTEFDGQRADLMVAIHAWRSARSAREFKAKFPTAPLVVLLSGTDIYRYQDEDPATTLATMELADWLVGLHDRVHLDIPERFQKKLSTIYQSCRPLAKARQPVRRHFQICVVGHLRDEKDSLRAAYAARLVPRESKLRVVHLGNAHDEAWAKRAQEETKTNPRYLWRGSVPRSQVRGYYSRSHAMVMSSVMEGGANAVSEAMVAGLPVLASDISGNRGLLGDEHEGYFPVGDEVALAALLLKAEKTPGFLEHLSSAAARRANRFAPDIEYRQWYEVLERLS